MNNCANILKQQRETSAQINTLLAKSTQALMCGPDCQKLRTTQKLEQTYLDSQTNMLTAPIQLEEAKKNYYTFSKGESAYNTMLEDELKKKADIIGEEIKKNFLEEVKKATTLNIYYNTDLINSKNTAELYTDFLNKNKEFEKTIKNIHGDILTQDRKIYYETQEYETLEFWYKFFLSVYYILVIIFVLGLIFSPNELKTYQKISILFLLIIYPFIINYIFLFIIAIFNNIKTVFSHQPQTLSSCSISSNK
jgi:hypothetical protein